MSQIAQSPPPCRHRTWFIVGLIAVAWFALAEMACHVWYYAHESRLKKNPVPASGEELIAKLKAYVEGQGAFQVRVEDVGETAREMLNCSFARTLSWVSDGRMAAVTVVRWDDRSSAGGVESSHNPGVCLAAAGWSIGKRVDMGFKEYCGAGSAVTQWEVSRPNIQMMAYSAVFRRFSGAPTIERRTSRGDLRWGAVFAGRRDAPVLVMLAYLQATPDEQALVNEKFDQLMRAALCGSGAK